MIIQNHFSLKAYWQFIQKVVQIKYMTNTIAKSDAKAKLPNSVANINKNLEKAIITVGGQPKVVMLSIDELESLEETAEVLSSIPGIKKDIEASRKQIHKGQFTSLSDLK